MTLLQIVPAEASAAVCSPNITNSNSTRNRRGCTLILKIGQASKHLLSSNTQWIGIPNIPATKAKRDENKVV